MVSMSKKTFSEKLAASRLWIQAGFLLLWLDPLTLRLHNICCPVFHCYACPLSTFACPIGVLANFSALHLFPALALGTIILTGAVFGGLVCGYACPFGLLQDLAARLPLPKFRLPPAFSYARYAVLVILVLAVPFFIGIDHPAAFCKLCPAGAIEASVPNMISQAASHQKILYPNAPKLIVLAVVIAGMLFVYRFWCRLCPLGAIFGLFNKACIFFLKFNPAACTRCQVCQTNCKPGASPQKDLNSSDCIRCLECTSCKSSAISFSTPLARSK
jgi:ferredoxin-type protein NapH